MHNQVSDAGCSRATVRGNAGKFAGTLALATSVSLFALSANAEVIWFGAVDPTDFPVTANQLRVGFGGSAGQLFIDAAATGNGLTSVTGSANSPATGNPVASGIRIATGAGSTGLVSVEGDGTAGSASLESRTGAGGDLRDIEVGHNGGQGTLNVTEGGLVLGRNLEIGAGTNATGSVSVDGDQSGITLGGDLRLANSIGASGSLSITGGASVEVGTEVNGPLMAGLASDAEASIVVSGANSSLTGVNGLRLGWADLGSGTDVSLLIEDGGLVTTPSTGVNQPGASFISANTDGTADVTVTGYGSRLEVGRIPDGVFNEGNELVVAGFGSSTVTVEDEGVIEVDGNVRVGASSTFTGYTEGTLIVRDDGHLIADNVYVAEPGLLAGGGGTIEADVHLDGGTITPGNSIGDLFVDGDIFLNSGLIQFEIEPGMWDTLTASGQIFIGSDMLIELIFGYDPMDEVFDLSSFFDAPSLSSNFQMDNLTLTGLSDAAYLTLITFGGAQVPVGNPPGNGNGTPPAVSAPAGIALLGFGLAGLGILRRRR